MSFVPYEKVSESSALFKSIKYFPGEDTRWVVTEKVHGANFQVVYESSEGINVNSPENGTVRFAKRTAMLEADEDFFGFRRSNLPNELADAVREVALGIDQRWSEISAGLGYLVGQDLKPLSTPQEVKKVSLIGELFGGGYPDMESPKGVQPIQTGISYCPDVRFYLFDIAIEGATSRSRGYLSYTHVCELAKKANVLFAEALFIGSMNKALEYTLGFDSYIPKKLQMPSLPMGSNKGVVIKPIVSKFCSGKKEGSFDRVIVKRKIEEFSEKRYNQARPLPAEESSAPDDEWMLYELLACVTPQRLDNVISKTGPCVPENKALCKEILSLLIADVFEDFQRDYDGEIPQVNPNYREQVNMACKQLIIEYFKGMKKA